MSDKPIIPTPEEYAMSGWEAPIKIICQELSTKVEDSIITAIQRIGIDVNQEELIKALAYDRQQYERGYINGYTKGFADAIVAMEVPTK